ncbi:polyprenyl diphosphate synthase, partial [Enterobacter hormaechei]|nr:polyprenyl diphosphate synthase [Enterobacter hormaechei]
KIAQQIKDNSLEQQDITEELVNNYMNLSQQPQVDLVIRTGGEHRISNFLLWQIAYAEFYFTDILWPDFDENVFEGAINAFAKRERRFGGTIPDDADVGS